MSLPLTSGPATRSYKRLRIKFASAVFSDHQELIGQLKRRSKLTNLGIPLARVVLSDVPARSASPRFPDLADSVALMGSAVLSWLTDG